ncbi:hypothetical protein J3R83DRAFT_11088 [Lanmaoa asiatica]|nr:hypothetical protein J3R83DRAFT_11088 [Lanmaoa asiatica]
MERSGRVFLKIASASNKVISAAHDYADRKDMCGVQRSHFHLEAEMRRISVACECIADILAKPTPPNGPAFDVRLQDWLDTDEPQKCLDTLIWMESLLRRDAFSWMPRTFGVGQVRYTTT